MKLDLYVFTYFTPCFRLYPHLWDKFPVLLQVILTLLTSHSSSPSTLELQKETFLSLNLVQWRIQGKVVVLRSLVHVDSELETIRTDRDIVSREL